MSQEFIVSILDDENDGDFSEEDLSLREAIATAESGDTITFDSNLSSGTIALVNGELTIDKNLAINGLGAEIIIDAGGNSRVFNIDDGNEDIQIDVAIDSLAITGGSGGEFDGTDMSLNNGGGILNSENLEVNNANIYNNETISLGGGIYSDGTLTVNTSAIYDNVINNDVDITDISGGGIYSDGILTVNNSAIYSNVANGGFTGASGGGIANADTATINQSTISNNIAAGRFNAGGGINNREGNLTITNSTISNNSSEFGGGIYNNAGEVTVTSTLIANDENNDVSGDDFVSGGNNLISGEAITLFRTGEPINTGAEGFTDGENGDIVGTVENPIDPLLGELQDNGGATPTQALLEGSPAIDAGSNPNNLAFDRRGEGFDRTVGDGTDIGAFEVQAEDVDSNEALVVSTLEDENDGDFSAGDLSLREAIALANEQEGENTITFDSILNGGTISINESLERDLFINDSVTINGLGEDNLTLDGGFIFNVTESDVDLAIDGLKLTGGKIESSGDLTLTNSTISQTIARPGSSDNSSIMSRGETLIVNSSIKDSSGGANLGILIESGTTTIEGSTIANNDASSLAQAGIIIRSDATANISNSTIADNQGRSNGGIENFGTANISNSTIVNNLGGLGGGGIRNFGNTTLTSSIVDNQFDNPSSDDVSGDISGDGEFTSGGNNLIGDSNGYEGFIDSDLLDVDSQTGELQENGGATQTIALLDGSPAIDAGSNSNNLETDQRGEGFDRTVGDGTDIGAYEVQLVDNPEQPNPPVDNVFIGTKGNDHFDGTAEDELILGLKGHDSLNGNDGNDTISGGKGDDRITGGNGNDILSGDKGNDTISGGHGHDKLLGGKGNDSLHGGAGDDKLLGGKGHDTLLGGDGNDILSGNRGDDLLEGGEGTDTLSGGHGHDIFVLEADGYRDIISDFVDGSDRLQLSGHLTFDNLIITNNSNNTGVLILDGANDDSIVAFINNVHAADITSHDFTNA